MLLSVLDNNLPPTVILGTVNNVDGESVDYQVKDALVVLYLDDQPIDTLTYYGSIYQNESPTTSSHYVSWDTIALVSEGVYHISASAPGYQEIETEHIEFVKVLSDSYEVRYVVYDTSLYLTDTLILQHKASFELINSAQGELRIEWVEPDPYYYYKLNPPAPEPGSPHPLSTVQSYPYHLNYGTVYGYDLQSGQYNDLSDQYATYYHYYSVVPICISTVHYNDAYLKFAELFSQQERENIGGLGINAQRLPSNIIGGYGYFSIRDRQVDCAFP